MTAIRTVSAWPLIFALAMLLVAACGGGSEPTPISAVTTTPATAPTPNAEALSPPDDGASSSTPEGSAPEGKLEEQASAQTVLLDTFDTPTSDRPPAEIVPFTDIAPQALGDKAFVVNELPGVAIFDYDRDGHLDFYITQTEGNSNLLFRNQGDGTYREVAQEAGVAAIESLSTGVVACDFNNDGYQDLYVGAQGRIGDDLDFRAAEERPELREAIMDRLFLNDTDGTFTDITSSAFGDAVNLRTAASPACADVDGDGWLDIYVANRADLDFFEPDRPSRGNLNVLYMNNGDLTFTEIAREAGVRGDQVVSWATLFFDYDDDGDPDLWVANDGDRLRVYRNDSAQGEISFAPVERFMGVDKLGAWMGSALGDFDGDGDLDVFFTNIGFHPRTRPPPVLGGASDCTAAQQFEWGTCNHFLLRNDGVRDVPRMGTAGLFHDVAPSTVVEPSRLMPPISLDPLKIRLAWQVPTGLAAYDFGFGAVFFDYENDGDQDLYWFGSALDRGEAPRGMIFPAAGRMLRGDGRGTFEDITVEAHLLDILDVDYSILDPLDPRFDAKSQRIGPEFHENGKGLAKGDLNNDGYVDLIATNSSGDVFEGDKIAFGKGPTFVWMNPGGQDHWVTLRLKGRMAIDGTGSNADAIGARVYLEAFVAGGSITKQVAEVLGSSSFLSMSSLDLNFGLGEAQEVERVTILWPSGVRQVLTNLAADQVITIEEPGK